MRRTMTVALLVHTLGCAMSAGRESKHVTLERELVLRSFAAAPLDSIAEGDSRFRVIALDPEVRRIPVAGTVDPLEFPVAFTVTFPARSHLRTKSLVLESASHSGRGDTLALTFAVVGTVPPDAESAYVFIFMTSERSYGIVGSIMFERRFGTWHPRLVHFQEG